MTTLAPAPAPALLDPIMRRRAIAFVTKFVHRYEVELAAPATTETAVAHHAIVERELEDWRRRLDRLRVAR